MRGLNPAIHARAVARRMEIYHRRQAGENFAQIGKSLGIGRRWTRQLYLKAVEKDVRT